MRLTVNDSQVTATDDVDVTTVNVPPVADAGPDQTVHERDLVTLNGGGSSERTAMTFPTGGRSWRDRRELRRN